MEKIIYLTTNPYKVAEAERIFGGKYGLEIECMKPDFEIPEIQAKSCDEVAKFSVKYAAERLGCPVLKSDSGLYIDILGGLPGPYNAYFDKQIGVEKFLKMLESFNDRKARIEHSYAFCAPGEEPIVFMGGSTGTISREAKGNPELGRWHDFFFIPDGESKTLCEIREINPDYELQFYGDAADQFAKWYIDRGKVNSLGARK